MTRIFIRADADTDIGMGHVVRMLALAEMLREEFCITFAIREPSDKIAALIKQYCGDLLILPREDDPGKDVQHLLTHISSNDIVVLDGYGFDTAFQRAVKNNGHRLVCIDDLKQFHFCADVVINQACSVKASDYSAEPYTRIFTGNEYLLLRKPFLEAAKSKRSVGFNGNIIIAMGGGDSNNITLAMMKICEGLEFIQTIKIIVGAANPYLNRIKEHANNAGKEYAIYHSLGAEEMREMLSSCNMIICPASSTAIEACAIKMGIITGITFDNQKDLHQSLLQSGCVLSVGDLNNANAEDVQKAFGVLISDKPVLKEMQKSQAIFADGMSGERIKKIFRELAYA